MSHHDVAVFDRRFAHHDDQIGRCAQRRKLPVNQFHGHQGNLCGPRMGAEDDAVAGREHPNGIADDRFRGIGCGRDGADHSKRRQFRDRQAIVSADRFGRKVFGAGRFFGGESVLDELVLIAAHAGFIHRHLGNLLQVVLLQNHFPDSFDKALAVGHGTEHILLLRNHGGFDSFVDRIKDSVSRYSAVPRFSFDLRIALLNHILENFFHQVCQQFFLARHQLFSRFESRQ